MDSHLHRTVHMVLVSLRGIARTGIHSPDNGMELKSPVFDRGKLIPKVYTRQGKDISPPLEWSGSPEGTRSFALICDDPDAPLLTWVHWVYYNIPATCTSLPEAIAKTEYPGQGASREGAAMANSAMEARVRPGAFTATFSGSLPWIPSSISRRGQKRDIS